VVIRRALALIAALGLLATACSSSGTEPGGEPSDGSESADGEAGAADGSGSNAAERSAAPRPAVLRTVDCPLALRVEQNTCGIAEVAADPRAAASETIEISYVVVEGSRSDAGYPLAVLQGGPGGASSDLAGWTPHREFTQVFVDQRGTGFADGDLDCPESDGAFAEAMTLRSADAETLLLDRLAQCAQRLAGNPLFEHTTTANQAADVISVMDALGYAEWVVYGVSYGTTIALEIMRTPPEGLQGAVLDGVYPPDIDTEESIALSAPAALAAAGDACAADPECPVANFDLAGTVERLIARFDETPARLDFEAYETALGEPLTAVMDGTRLAEFVFVSLYDENWAKLAVESLTRIEQGDRDALRGFLSTAITITHLQSGAIADAAYYAVECHERLPLHDGPGGRAGPGRSLGDSDGSTDGSSAQQRDAFAAAILATPLADACEPWDRPAVVDVEPVRSDLPVLTLSNDFDPITPARLAWHANATLADVVHIIADGHGHGRWFSDPTIADRVDAFVADPHTALAGSG